MLKRLSIKNYAIIDELEIEFDEKLNIVTGETGAGKSILVGALGLILGDRADTSVLPDQGTKEKKCIAEGLFLAENRNDIFDFLQANELDAEEEILVRREIGSNGKSRAFINDTPVNLDQLRMLSALLVDMHLQFDTLQLTENDFQRSVMDALAGHKNLLDEYKKQFSGWKNLQRELEQLKEQKIQLDKEAGLNRFLFDELDSAGFSENELEDAESELALLNNAEGIKTALQKVQYELSDTENPVILQLKTLISQLQHFASFHSGLPAMIQRLQSTQIELQDIAGEIDHIHHGVENNPERIELLNDKISMGFKLLKKHGVKTTAELLAIKEELGKKLQTVHDLDEIIREKEKSFVELEKSLAKLAKKITDGRISQVKPLQEKTNKLLARVGMPNARLEVDIREGHLQAHGADMIDFLFDANKSGQFLPVKKVASGGELSRLMLCLKSLVAKQIDLPTMIFDEIDTGISGEAARQVGFIMKELAVNRQLICITHQPQIAGKADAHFLVYKEIVKDKVKTNIRRLTMDERITAIARMLSGEKPTAAAMENAREMVGN
jgi:DNA repair protein RecN (Recombination protein N)